MSEERAIGRKQTNASTPRPKRTKEERQEARKRGIWGEALAAWYLKQRGLHIIERNWRTRYGELDLIAKQGDLVIFVEVKLRKNACFATAAEAVTYSKQQKLCAAAALWLEKYAQNSFARFDVLEIYAPDNDPAHVRFHLIENAFDSTF
jgi:putative endonuclease